MQSEILTGFRIVQLQRIADSSFFRARILDFACNKSIFARISDSGEILTADLFNKNNGSADLHTPIHPPHNQSLSPKGGEERSQNGAKLYDQRKAP